MCSNQEIELVSDTIGKNEYKCDYCGHEWKDGEE
jgi:DNA-directed RNA polymerase subunit RPC12/RpoP